jgi:hypothetical protein
MTSVLTPLAVQVAVVVAVAQVLIGLAIAIGRPLRLALWAGVVLNVVFVLCGKVNPSAFYLVMEAALLYAVSTGVLGRGYRQPSARSFLLVGGWLTAAAAMAPFVSTLEPADVIEDPAMMLVFLSLVMAGTTLARWLHHYAPRITALTDVSVRPVQSWLLCGMRAPAPLLDEPTPVYTTPAYPTPAYTTPAYTTEAYTTPDYTTPDYTTVFAPPRELQYDS